MQRRQCSKAIYGIPASTGSSICKENRTQWLPLIPEGLPLCFIFVFVLLLFLLYFNVLSSGLTGLFQIIFFMLVTVLRNIRNSNFFTVQADTFQICAQYPPWSGSFSQLSESRSCLKKIRYDRRLLMLFS